MISFQSVSLQMGLKSLFEDTSFCFYPGQKVGLVGKNGAGKTTLFSMVMKLVEPDAGKIEVASSLDIAYVKQEVEVLDETVINYVQSGDEELYGLECQINALSMATTEKELEKLGHLYEAYESLGGYQLRSRAFQLLHGLGFEDEQIEGVVSDLSGGWQIRLNLAKALIRRSDILLLDEPTNHLDVEAVMWLEKWLKQYPGMILLISHDRTFLDNTVDVIAHIDALSIKTYSGNYSQFERQRSEALILQQKAHVKQQKTVAHLQSFVDRFKAKASKAKQAQSRMKMLEKIQQVDAVKDASQFSFNFSEVEEQGGPLLTLSKADCGYDGVDAILSGVSTSILSGMRIGLLGVNGAGKSTFIKSMVGSLPLLVGEYLPHSKLRIGYFEQHSIQQLDLEATPLEHFQSIAKDKREGELRAFLGRFAFSNETALTKVKSFSGGEKARLALALIVFQKPNLLLLDEPTNHLDINMRQALTMAMQTYNGAVIIVSHDRYLLEATVDEYWLVNKGDVKPFQGDLEDYQKLIMQQKQSDNREAREAKTVKKSKKENKSKNQESSNSKELKQLKNKIKQLENKISRLQVLIAECEEELQNPKSSGALNQDVLDDRLKDYEENKVLLSAVELEWMGLSEAYESEAGH